MAEMMLKLTLKGRHVFLSGKIDDESAKAAIATLMYLEQEEPGAPIRLHINSSGGKVSAGLAIHDAMQLVSSPVHTVCLGHCESMAAILLAAGAAGQRAAMANARIMIHQPVLRWSGSSHSSRQLAIHAASIERSRMRVATLISQHTGRPLSEIESLIEYDYVCDATEALALGLIDRVLEPGDLVPTATAPTANGSTTSSHRSRGTEAAEGAPPHDAPPLGAGDGDRTD